MSKDMLVSLLDLPDITQLKNDLAAKGIHIRRAMTPDKYVILPEVENMMSVYAKGEADVCFSRQPVSLFIATIRDKVIGFACYDGTYRNFFGPTAVQKEYQGLGIGKALLVETLADMRNVGYAYAIIGSAGPAKFYEKCVGAKEIEGSDPGIYKDFLLLLKEESHD